jgi:hypothetical protein
MYELLNQVQEIVIQTIKIGTWPQPYTIKSPTN